MPEAIPTATRRILKQISRISIPLLNSNDLACASGAYISSLLAQAPANAEALVLSRGCSTGSSPACFGLALNRGLWWR